MRAELREEITRVARFLAQAELAKKLEKTAEEMYKVNVMTSEEFTKAFMEVGRYKAKFLIAIGSLANEMTAEEARNIDEYLKDVKIDEYFISDVTETVYAVLGKDKSENALNKIFANM